MPIIVAACLCVAVPERWFALLGGRNRVGAALDGPVAEQLISSRLWRLSDATVLGRRVHIATGFRARLLGLAWIDREAAGEGLLIPRCSSIHTFGMRFALDLLFLDEHRRPLEVHHEVGPRRIVSRRGAAAVLELPSPAGGDFSPLPDWGR
jgi:uncharacterized protein